MAFHRPFCLAAVLLVLLSAAPVESEWGNPPWSYEKRASHRAAKATAAGETPPGEQQALQLIPEPKLSEGEVCDGACMDPDVSGLGVWNSDDGTSRYEGHWVDGEYEGEGKLMLSDGTTYTGFFIEGEFDGKGHLTEPSKTGKLYTTYEGDFQDGQFHGQGTYTHGTGSTYEGSWVDGKYHGDGTFYQAATMDKYVGEWSNGEQEGYGSLFYRNGARHKGYYKANVQHGYGEYSHPPTNGFAQPGPGGTLIGGLYRGMWENGEYHGLGVYLDPIGMRYEGYWHFGKPHKHGSWSSPTGENYKGQFAHGDRVGLACWKQASGIKYCGQYANNKKNGLGVWTHPNGNRYAGQFKDNKMEGVGIMVHNDATVYEGEFSKGHKHGLGLATEPGGWIFGEHSYEGKWKKGNYKGVLKKQAGKGLEAKSRAVDAANQAEVIFKQAEQAAFEGVAAGAFATVENDSQDKKAKEVKAYKKAKELAAAGITVDPDTHMYEMPDNHLDAVATERLP